MATKKEDKTIKTVKKAKEKKNVEKKSKKDSNADKVDEGIKDEKVSPPVEDVKTINSSSIGEDLKSLREKKKIGLDAVSAELNIKISQLEAIERGDLEKLPEMIYAVGFVRNYANYLGMDSVEASERFKAEHSDEPVKQEDFDFPEPLYENSIPGPTIIGIGAFLSIIILFAWVTYSSFDIDSVVKSDSEAVFVETNQEAEKAPDEEPKFVEAEDLKKSEEAAIAEKFVQQPDKVEEKPADITAKAPENKKVKKKEINIVTPKEVTIKENERTAGSNNLKNISEETEVKTVATNKPVMELSQNKEEPKKVAKNINIQKRKGPVVLKAKEASWVQITDKKQNVIFRKVLRPGDEYVVPNQRDLILVTANAGGLEVYVRGKAVQSIGDSGEIVRGVSLNPEDLGLQRIKAGVRR